MQPGGILGLDLSTKCGWAYGAVGARPLSGVWRLPSIVNAGACGAALIERLQDTIAGMQPSLIVCEAPLPPQAQTHMATARIQFGLAFAVELVGHWLDVRVLEERADEVRQNMLGRSRFPKGQVKPAVMAWVQSQGLEPADDNEADALLLWFHACQRQPQKGSPR